MDTPDGAGSQDDRAVRARPGARGRRQENRVVRNVELRVRHSLRGRVQAIHEYHRLGMDYASVDIGRCKNLILQALERMDEAHQSYPNTLALRMFALTKVDELVEIFKGAAPDQKTRMIAIMQKIDPSNASKYTQVGF